MRIFSVADVRRNVDEAQMVEALRQEFRNDVHSPLRHRQAVDKDNGEEHVFLTMPSWGGSGLGCVKLVNIVPGNRERKLPSVMSNILLFSVDTGEHLAIIDGGEVTSLRTACASALAADYLAREDAEVLLVVGAGSVGSRIPNAYRAVRNIKKVVLWNVNPSSSAALAEKLSTDEYETEIAEDLEAAVTASDIVSCATLATEPLIRGDWLQPGQHVDLIGSFLPTMREADDRAITRSEVFLDTEAAAQESGDIIDPIENGTLPRERIRGDLHDLCRGEHPGRTDAALVTLFKSVGTGLEDLAAAKLIHRVCA